MDVTLVPPYKSLFRPPQINRKIPMQNPKRRSPFILSVLADDLNNKSPTNNGTKNIYNDNWFHRLAINHLSHSLQASAGHKNKGGGYDGLVEAARMAYQNFSPSQQREIILQTLDIVVPKPIFHLARTLLPPSKRASHYFAVMTTVLFSWLVGPCEVRESENEGEKEKNVVYIPKCRFLEETNCVGMCTNLCKMPSQEFIKENLGIPLNMVPNFDDMSCKMIFGQEPPPRSLDPASTQPCYKQCKTTKRHHETCTN